jgi:hypothetical protein
MRVSQINPFQPQRSKIEDQDDLLAATPPVFLLPEYPNKLVLDIVLRHLHIGFDGVEDR